MVSTVKLCRYLTSSSEASETRQSSRLGQEALEAKGKDLLPSEPSEESLLEAPEGVEEQKQESLGDFSEKEGEDEAPGDSYASSSISSQVHNAHPVGAAFVLLVGRSQEGH